MKPSDIEEMEQKVSHGKRGSAKLLASLMIASLVGGSGLIWWGVGVLRSTSEVAADVSGGRTGFSATSLFPTAPPAPGSDSLPSEQDARVVPSGWSMLPASLLQGVNLHTVLNAGLSIYSYNDPGFPSQDWTIYSQDNLADVGKDAGPRAYNPRGYYAYNPTQTPVSVSLGLSDALSPDAVWASGWHLLYHGGAEALSKNEFLGKLKLKGASGEIVSAAQAVSPEFLRMSQRIYVVMNESSLESQAIKELSHEITNQTVNKVPAKSYFWIYLRVAGEKNRTVNMTFGDFGELGDSEEAKINAWLKANNLNECGDSPDTIYAGGSCLFDESTGKKRDKYEYLKEKFPNKPWNS